MLFVGGGLQAVDQNPLVHLHIAQPATVGADAGESDPVQAATEQAAKNQVLDEIEGQRKEHANPDGQTSARRSLPRTSGTHAVELLHLMRQVAKRMMQQVP